MRIFWLLMILLPAAANAGEWRYSGASESAQTATVNQTEGTGTQQMQETGTHVSMNTPLATDPPANVPTNYMSMRMVLNDFGEPHEIIQAVGDPPITRWRYPDYIVYFEHDRVITSIGVAAVN